MAQRPRQHRLGQVEAPAAVGGERRLEREQPAVVVEADLPLAWKPCRLPVIVMSCVRVSRSRTGRPVRVAPRAAMAANPCGCISLPPNPPPIRRHCTVTSWLGTAEHVRDDLLGLGRVLGAALHEHLPGLVDQRERRCVSR